MSQFVIPAVRDCVVAALRCSRFVLMQQCAIAELRQCVKAAMRHYGTTTQRS
jgi:hypothetical protein